MQNSKCNDFKITKWQEPFAVENGINSRRLEEIKTYIKGKLPHIRSLIILQHGHLVLEEYFQGYNKDDYMQLASATKSFSSALIGIALTEGMINSLDQRLVDFFPEYVTSDIDIKINEITIRHLLTMTSGLDWPPPHVTEKTKNDDITYAFKLSVSEEPGQIFKYKPDSHILYWLLQKITGMSIKDIADQYLFKPLNITQCDWLTNFFNYHGLFLRSRDIAKFGYLFLRRGSWNGKRIISEEFIQDSTKKQIDGGFPENEDYGYLWWVKTVKGHSAYFAGGFGGQYIYIVPDLDIVIVTMSNLDRPHQENRKMIEEVIIPSIID